MSPADPALRGDSPPQWPSARNHLSSVLAEMAYLGKPLPGRVRGMALWQDPSRVWPGKQSGPPELFSKTGIRRLLGIKAAPVIPAPMRGVPILQVGKPRHGELSDIPPSPSCNGARTRIPASFLPAPCFPQRAAALWAFSTPPSCAPVPSGAAPSEVGGFSVAHCRAQEDVDSRVTLPFRTPAPYAPNPGGGGSGDTSPLAKCCAPLARVRDTPPQPLSTSLLGIFKH